MPQPHPKLKSRFAPALLAARRRAGLTQQALARIMGVDRSVLAKQERGYNELTEGVVLRWADALGMSVSELLAGV